MSRPSAKMRGPPKAPGRHGEGLPTEVPFQAERWASDGGADLRSIIGGVPAFEGSRDGLRRPAPSGRGLTKEGQRSAARRVGYQAASIEPGCGADGLSHHPHAPWRSACRRFDDSGPRLSGRRPACAASPFDASSPHRVVASNEAWDAGVMPPTGPASSSHRDHSVPRAVPRSLPGLACKASRRRRAHPHQRLAFRMAAPRG